MIAVGPLLARALEDLGPPKASGAARKVEGFADIGNQEDIAVILRLPHAPPASGTSWAEHREKVSQRLTQVSQALDRFDTTHLIAGRSLQTRVTPSDVQWLIQQEDLGLVEVELDPMLPLALLDQVPGEIDLAPFHAAHPDLDGTGVKVAVLDTGIDTAHPALAVSDARSCCDEPVTTPGDHGTHCAGIIASRDSVYAGLAPGVTLLDVKILNANGIGKPGDIARGVDAALDLGADILSMSVGTNHLPTTFFGGNGWSCRDGRCTLCMAVDNVFLLDGALAIVAVGNDHDKAESMREQGLGSELDTEVSCPGQARNALGIGAVTKPPFQVATFSSRGPTAYGTTKPDVAAPGVGVTSAVKVPRDATGAPLPSVPRDKLFASRNGTSVATPVVAALAALAAQELSAAGTKATPAQIRDWLLSGALSLGAGQANDTGAGRVRAGGT